MRCGLRTSNVRLLRGGVLLCAAAFIIVGLLGQEQLLVLQKAVRICLECIGIG